MLKCDCDPHVEWCPECRAELQRQDTESPMAERWLCPKCNSWFTESDDQGYDPESNLCPECQKTRTDADDIYEPGNDADYHASDFPCGY